MTACMRILCGSAIKMSDEKNRRKSKAFHIIGLIVSANVSRLLIALLRVVLCLNTRYTCRLHNIFIIF